MKKTLAACLVVCAASAFAEDAFWAGTSGVKVWTGASAWTNSSGAVVSAPVAAGDTATFPRATSSLDVSLFADEDATAFSVAKITASLGWNFTFPVRTDTLESLSRTVSVGDVSEVEGFWKTYELNSGLVFTGGAGYEGTLSQVSGENRFVVDVENAGAKVTLGALAEGGSLVKRGEGTLVVEKVLDGAVAKIYADAGTLELTGLPDAAAYPVEGLLLHLDATDDSTLVKEKGADGRVYVSKWRDADGGDAAMVSREDYVQPSSSYAAYAQRPFVSTAVSVTGRRFVDFGSNNKDTDAVKAEHGPTNCMMVAEGSAITGVREAFYVASYTKGAWQNNVSVLGGDFWKGNVSAVYHSNASLGNADVRAGEFYLNGAKIPYFQNFTAGYYTDRFSSGFGDVHVMNYVPDGSAKVNYIGATDAWATRCGGVRIGEVLLYDRRLTDDERRAVTRYLMNRWLADSAAYDLQGLVVGGDDVTVSVPAGHVARVASVTVEGSKLVKTGEGVLEVGSIYPAATVLDIKGGSVRYAAGDEDVPTGSPAASPYLHLDATRKSTLTTVTEGDTEYVEKWACAAGGTVTAGLPVSGTDSGYTGNRPVYRPAAQNGNAVIDFGSKSDASARSWLKLSEANSAKVQEAYIAFRFKTATSSCRLFGGSNRDMLGNATMFVNPANCANAAAAATWTVDGCVEDPTKNCSARHGTDFHVVGFASASKVRSDFIANDRQTAATSGDIEIGEYIIYDRRLTAAERRQTEAYLMSKWLGKAHPQTADGAERAGIAFSSGSDGMTIVKTGDSAASVLLDEIPDLGRLSVEGGTLDMSAPDPAEKAYFHLDAGNGDSLTLEKINGKNFVSSWADTRANGLAATNAIGWKTIVTNPTLVSVTMPDGAVRSAVHFGKCGDANTMSGLLFNDKSASQSNTREVHVIVADYAPANTYGWLLGTTGSSALYRPYGTSSTDPDEAKGQLFRSSKYSYMSAIPNGYIALDGVETNVYAKLSDTVDGTAFRLLSVVPAAGVWVDALGISSAGVYGGIVVAEQLVYRTALSDIERARLQSRLMNKWFGFDPTFVYCALDELQVAAGATADFGEESVVVNTLTGSGTVSAKLVSGVSEIEWTLGADAVTVSGGLSFGETLTVKIVDGGGRVGYGDYVVLNHPSVASLGSARLELDASALRRGTAELVVSGESLCLRYRQKGAVVIVR